MEYNRIPGTELNVSRVCVGTMTLADQVDEAAAARALDIAAEKGVNFIDTADIYSMRAPTGSEKMLGELLRTRRGKFLIATKAGGPTGPGPEDRGLGRVHLTRAAEASLRRLGTDHIDFYLCHAVMDNVYKDYLDCGCIDYLLEQRAAGRIRYLGFSSHATPQVLRIFADSYGRPWDFVQIQCNYYDWRYSTTREEYEILRDRGIPIMVMEPVRGGRLAQLTPGAERPLRAAHPDWTPASWALRWVRSLPQVQTVLSGMSTLGQIQNNVATFSDEESLSERDKGLLERACETFHDELSIPCTACRYCTDTCPAGIDIPQVLALANKVRMGSQGALRDIRKVEGGQPENCVGCAQCTEHCPQGIDTPAVMAEMSERLATAGV